jgi:hypothetical protein
MALNSARDGKLVGLGMLGVCVGGLAPIAWGQGGQPLDATSIAAGVSRDTNTRLSLDDEGGVAGFRDGEFSLSDGSGNNTLTLGGFSLFRYYAAKRSGDAPLTGASEFTHGFQFATVEVHATGTIASPDLSYAIVAEFEASGVPTLQDAWVLQRFADTPWALRAGQFSPGVLREYSVSQSMQLAIERSQVSARFNQGFSQGLELAYTAQQYRAMASLTDGFRSAVSPGASNSAYDSTSEADYGVSARGEWMFSGSDWDRFNHFSSWRSNPTYAGVIGAAIAFQSFGGTGATSPVTGGTDLTYTLDVSTQGSGWNSYLAFVGNVNDTDGLVQNSSFGAVVQGGYFVADQVEVYGRYEWMRLDPDFVGSTDDTLNFLTLGANYFVVPESEAVRLSADVVYSVNKTDGLLTTSDTTTGLLGDSSAGELDLRLQVRVRF